MKYLQSILGFGIMLVGAIATAPRAAGQGPLVSGTGPEIEAHGGFEYIGQQVPSVSNVPMYGVNSGVTVGVSSHLGVRLDLGYARAGNVFSSGYTSDILSYMAGPVIYSRRIQRFSPYAELLVGGARVTGATPDVQGGYARGYVNQLAWAGGGGVEIRTSPGFALRVGADYMHTSYFDPTLAIAGQGNIRGIVSFTYYLGGRRR
jgi:outer membrane immunogenic protein